MASTNDCKNTALDRLGFLGNVSDQELEWLQSLGATSGQINDAWLEVAGAGQINDQRIAYMKLQGALGDHINDIMFDFWCRVMGGAVTGDYSGDYNLVDYN